MPSEPYRPQIAVIGSGPAGLSAAVVICAQGHCVHVFDAMPSFGRKFLMAGKSGLNITHAEDKREFLSRYGSNERIQSYVTKFGAGDIVSWMEDLGIHALTGPTGRVFPSMMKASPLLRNWLRRLDENGVNFYRKHRWQGWDENGKLMFDTPEGRVTFAADATLLALGGASWKRLGSDGQWSGLLEAKHVELTPFLPSNCGFLVDWSERIKAEFSGHPIKAVEIRVADETTRSEFVITHRGVESGGIYTLSGRILAAIASSGSALVTLDLMPDISRDELAKRLGKPRGKASLSNHIRKATGLGGAKLALVFETQRKEALQDMDKLTNRIKCLPIKIHGAAPIDEAISTSGGVAWNALNDELMLKQLPGVFCAGEMIDWDAPTGGYLITACMATGRAAGAGIVDWIKNTQPQCKH